MKDDQCLCTLYTGVAASCNRDENEIQLIPVSKTKPAGNVYICIHKQSVHLCDVLFVLSYITTLRSIYIFCRDDPSII